LAGGECIGKSVTFAGDMEMLRKKLALRDVRQICAMCRDDACDSMKECLYAAVSDTDDRVGYNALWVFTHFSPEDKR